MKRTLTLGTVSLVASALLVGCGSDSSSSNDLSDSTSANISTTQSTETLTGYFIDAAVANVDYKTTSGLAGTTDKFGRFQYKEGDRVSLYIGKLFLGDATPEEGGVITPKALSQGDEEREVLLLRTLQTLDVDGDSSNGIVIPQKVSEDLKEIEETSIADHNEQTLIELIDINDNHSLDRDYDGQIDVKDKEAKEHFNHSEQEWNEGVRPDTKAEVEHNTNNQEHGQSENESGHENESETESQNHEFDLSAYPVTPSLSTELKNSLAYMGNEERLAYDVYQNLYNYHITESATEVKQLKNISEKSEIKHIGIVQDVVKRYALNPEDVTNVVNPVADRDVAISAMPSGEYDIPAIQELYNVLYAKGTASTTEALMVGCMVEVTDVEDLDKYIEQAESSNAKDIVEAFTVLRAGSYNHYWAFDKGLKNAGVANGCYVEGDSLLTNKEGVYPTSDHGSDESHGKDDETAGQGQGQGQGRK